MGRLLRPLEGKTVLVVEDNFLVAEDLRILIVEAGGIVAGPVATSHEAHEVLQEETPHGVLLDFQLRNGDAQEIAEMLRRRGIPFVIVTGFAREMLPGELRAAPYMSKPVMSADLVSLAARTFRNRMRPD